MTDYKKPDAYSGKAQLCKRIDPLTTAKRISSSPLPNNYVSIAAQDTMDVLRKGTQKVADRTGASFTISVTIDTD